MFLRGSLTVKLSNTDGTVTTYNDYKLPSLLRHPLIQTEDGSISTYASGGRSSIVHAHKKWFKKKGDKPLPGFKYRDEPYGGMSPEKAMTELRTSEKVDAKLREFGYHGALYPAAFVEYEIPFENGRNVCSAILETYGDTRVGNLTARLLKDNRHGVRLDKEFREELLMKLSSWLGFTHRIMAETSTFPAPISYELGNYAIYNLGNGFGVSRIDFGSSKPENSQDHSNLYYSVFNELVSTHVSFVASSTANRLGLSFKELAHDFEYQKLALQGTDDEEKLVSHNGRKVLFVKKDEFKVLNKFETFYRDALDGKVVPEPVDKKLIYRVFDTVKIEHKPTVVYQDAILRSLALAIGIE